MYFLTVFLPEDEVLNYNYSIGPISTVHLHSHNPDEINTSAVWSTSFYPRGSCNKKSSHHH